MHLLISLLLMISKSIDQQQLQVCVYVCVHDDFGHSSMYWVCEHVCVKLVVDIDGSFQVSSSFHYL